jgi:hypothetical protein
VIHIPAESPLIAPGLLAVDEVRHTAIHHLVEARIPDLGPPFTNTCSFHKRPRRPALLVEDHHSGDPRIRLVGGDESGIEAVPNTTVGALGDSRWR